MIEIKLTEEEYAFCEHSANLRSALIKPGDDPSLDLTTYPDERGNNNIMGQVAEYATLKLLQKRKIAFSGVCFTITFINKGKGVLPPLFDFLLPDGQSIDVKADRYDITRYGAVIPNEKLIDIHLADYTLWLEFNEKDTSRTVKFHGWNTREDLMPLRNEPDATTPGRHPMPKPCKRVPKKLWREMEGFLTSTASITATNKNRISIDRLPHPAGSSVNDFVLEEILDGGKDAQWSKPITKAFLESTTAVKITVDPYRLKNGKIALTVVCQHLMNPYITARAMTLLDGADSTRAFHLTIIEAMRQWLEQSEE